MKDQMRLLLVVIFTCLCVHPSESQRGRSCITPNRRTATCVSVYDCPHFVNAVRANVPSQIEFIQRSQCGWDTNALVCCGNDIDYTTTTTTTTTTTLAPIGRNLLTQNINNRSFRRSSIIPNRSTCGFQEADNGVGGFIFGGTEPLIDEFPWMALLGYTDNFGNRKWSCGGTLISARYVLTAAHCVTGEVLRRVGRLNSVKLGEHNTVTDVDCDKNSKCNTRPIIAGVETSVFHPMYDSTANSPYDIALVRLNQNVRYSNFVRPICLPEPNESSRSGDNLFTAGWGKIENDNPSPVILKVEIPFIDSQQCSRLYLSQGFNLLDSQICAGGEGGKDSCSGDSGGPLMRRSTSNSLQWYQEGIVSFGAIKCGIKGLPGVYTRVADFLPWIHSNVRN